MIEMPYIRQATAFPVSYAYGPDSLPQLGVTVGVVHEFDWSDSQVFPDWRPNFRLARSAATGWCGFGQMGRVSVREVMG